MRTTPEIHISPGLKDMYTNVNINALRTSELMDRSGLTQEQIGRSKVIATARKTGWLQRVAWGHGVSLPSRLATCRPQLDGSSVIELHIPRMTEFCVEEPEYNPCFLHEIGHAVDPLRLRKRLITVMSRSALLDSVAVGTVAACEIGKYTNTPLAILAGAVSFVGLEVAEITSIDKAPWYVGQHALEGYADAFMNQYRDEYSDLITVVSTS